MTFDHTIWYITRTWPKTDADGCGILRAVYAEYLEQIGKVIVVTPNYESSEIIVNDKMVSIPYRGSAKWNHRFEKIGIIEDYLDEWVHETTRYLMKHVHKEDLIFTTTGGELGCVKIGALLKSRLHCRFYIHFHDPINGDIIFNEKNKGYNGLPRRRKIHKYVRHADCMITSSELFLDILKARYPQRASHMFSQYFGYIKKATISKNRHTSDPLNIVYAGSTSIIQNVDVLYHAFKGRTDVTITFICADYRERKERMPEENIRCIPLMPYDKFLDYMANNADIGFLSLTGKYAGVCIPSKLYEYINIGIPVLGCLPDGPAKNIINHKEYGIAVDDGDIDSLRAAYEEFKKTDRYSKFFTSIVCDKEYWWADALSENFLSKIEEELGVERVNRSL